MIKVKYRGRLGNNLIQYAAAYVLSKKTGVSLDDNTVCDYKKTTAPWFHDHFPDQIELIDFRKIINEKLTHNDTVHDKFVELGDANYFYRLNNPATNTGYILNGFFQDGRLLCDHRSDILELYKPGINLNVTTDISQNDAFVACRLGDCLLKSNLTMCTMKYIENQIKTNRHNYRNVYITSDSLDHPPLVKLIEKYSMIKYNNNPLDTILFASKFNNLILSAGSFSYWMAYLSEATNITVYNHEVDPLQQHNAWRYNKNVKFFGDS